MKFGNLIHAALAACVLAAASAHADPLPLYLFGNAPTAGAQVPTDPDSPNYDVITKRNDFTAAVVLSRPPETFEAAPVGLLANTSDNALTVFGSATMFLRQSPPDGDPYFGAQVRTDGPFEGRFNTTPGGSQWIESDSSFTIDLGSATAGAIGFFGTDFGDFEGSLKIAIYGANGNEIDDNIFTDAGNNPLQPRTGTPNAQDGSLFFFGYASEQQFSKIVFTVTQSSTPGDPGFPPILGRDILGFDDLMIGNLRNGSGGGNAPEPGSLALVGLALFAATWARKTQRRA